MGDLLFVAITITFFALAAGYVVLCDRIIGPDTDFDLLTGDEDVETVVDDRGETLERAAR
jgi:hypothetical protein